MPERFANYIGGRWTPPDSNRWIPNVNPADTTDILGEFPESAPSDAARAIQAAAEAQSAWADLSSAARGELLRRAADRLEAEIERVAADLMREEGKSLPEARGETQRAVAILRYCASQTLLPEGEVIPSFSARTFLFTQRVPLGPCVLITPWNFPIAIPVWKAAPALAFGNSVIVKPSELAPMTAWHLARVFEDVGLPPGVFNLVHGSGSSLGDSLLTHPSVAAVSFTGSVTTGRFIAETCARHGKKYQLEMGGQNAAIVLDDADLEQAVTLVLSGAYKSAGQKCTATSRVIVTRGIYDRFAALLAERARALRVGPGDDSSAYLGPVITATARDKLLQATREAVDQGAQLLAGGEAAEDRLKTGYYVSPILLGEVTPSMRAAQEEIFGPFLCLMRADNLDHALEIMNGVSYGLSASLFTRDLNAAMCFVKRAQAGMVRVNGETAGVEPQAPFGGMKGSSSFSREQGMAARDFFTQIKTVSVDLAG
jgi:aldehyde dehydrogenase (NAD+)